MRIANITQQAVEHLHPNEGYETDGVLIESVYAKTKLPASKSRLRQLEQDIIYVEAALRAERDGVDAVVINTMVDYAIDLIRDTLSIPVVGAGESGMGAVVEQGLNFSVVTVWPDLFAPYYSRVLAENDFEGSCRSIRYALQESDGQPAREVVYAGVEDAGSSVAQRVLSSAQSAIERDGAESIVIGCTCMTGLVDFLSENVSVPVVDPLGEAYKKAVAQVRRRESGGSLPVITSRDSEREFAERIQIAVDAWVATPSFGEAELECGNACLIAS